MKSKINKIILNLRMVSALLLVTSFSLCTETGDIKQLLHIESDTQSFDMKGNVLTFGGKVVMTYGAIKVNTDKVIITCPSGEKGKEIIDGYGNPATFYQMQSNGKLVKGHASHIHYELAKDILVLTGNAHIEQINSNITCDKITYLVKTKNMQAYSEKGNRITTVLISSGMKDKK